MNLDRKLSLARRTLRRVAEALQIHSYRTHDPEGLRREAQRAATVADALDGRRVRRVPPRRKP